MKALLLFLVFLFPALVFSAGVQSDTFTIGKPGSNSDKLIDFGGSSKGKIRYNENDDKLQFSHNGVDYKTIGSGGASGGDNLLVDDNPDFEGGTTSWTLTGGGSFTVESSAPLIGLKSAKFNSSSTGQKVCSTLKLIKAGYQGRNCQVHIPYYQYASGSSGDYELNVYNGEGVEILSMPLSVTGASATLSSYQAFSCPALNGSDNSDQLQMCMESTVDGGDILFDETFLGQGRNYGPTIPGNAITTNILSANVTSNGGIADLQFSNLVVGKWYEASGQVKFQLDVSSADNTVDLTIQNNGATISHYDTTLAESSDASTDTMVIPISFKFQATASTLVFTAGSASANSLIVGNGTRAATYVQLTTRNDINQMPQDSLTLETTGWRVDASIGGGNPSLGTSAQTSYIAIANSNLDLINNSGRGVITAQIPCSSTNPPTGLTCAAGDETVGVSFVLPRAQDVMACASFTAYQGSNALPHVTYQIVETSNNAQTILQEGKSRAVTGTTSAESFQGVRVCGTLSFSSDGQKTIRLMYEQTGKSTAPNIAADREVTQGQRDIHFEVWPINEQFPTPVFTDLTNSLNQKISGGMSGVKAYGFQTNCDASSSILSDSASVISSIGNISAGACTVTLNNGKFTTAPICLSQEIGNTNPNKFLRAEGASATSITLDCDTDGGTDCTSYDVNVMCWGN